MLIKTCSQCGKKGVFLKLNSDSICSSCEKNAAKSFIENFATHIKAATAESVISPGLGSKKINQQYDECTYVLEHIDDWKSYSYFEDAFYETLRWPNYSWCYSPLFGTRIIWPDRDRNNLIELFDNLRKTVEKLRFDCLCTKNKAYDYAKVFHIVGVTFKNGRKHRQTILRRIKFRDPPYQHDPDFYLEKYTFDGEDAFGVFVWGATCDEQVGNISRDDISWLQEHWDEYAYVDEYDIIGGGPGLSYGLVIRVVFRKKD